MTSCGFGPCADAGLFADLFSDAPFHEVTDFDRTIVFEEGGKIIAYHGYACAESDKSGQEDVLRVEQTIDLPPYATNATVFLNGWRVRYLHDDYRVASLATVITNIRVDGQTLKWDASGILSDRHFDDAYSWCHYYTTIAWNQNNTSFVVDQDGDKQVSSENLAERLGSNFFIERNDRDLEEQDRPIDAAVSSFPTFLTDRRFASVKTVAILPRGFGFGWADSDVDHDMFQLGYHMDHNERFIENNKRYKKMRETFCGGEDLVFSHPTITGRVDPVFVSWEASAIFKDEDTERDYVFGELVSGLGGNDIGVIQPPFAILPFDTEGSTDVPDSSGVRTQEFTVIGIPFQQALAVLTGWNLAYVSHDAHVKQIGVWIDDMRYDKDPNSPTGTLHYTLSSVLRDNNGKPGFQSAHKVTVLGLPALGGVIGLK